MPYEAEREGPEGGSSVLTRGETEADIQAIRAVHMAAFETSLEADLVEALRREAAPLLSLVADLRGRVIGHVLFSPVTVASSNGDVMIMGLGPMAVIPEHQRTGVGSELVRAGLAACRDLGCGAAVVLGHPEYYPRFGFTTALDFGLHCEFHVPPEVFMAVELVPGALNGTTGVVRYAPPFRST